MRLPNIDRNDCSESTRVQEFIGKFNFDSEYQSIALHLRIRKFYQRNIYKSKV